jgi:molybdopterin converting factor small subunit
MKLSVVITGRHYHESSTAPKELTLPNRATIEDALQMLADHMPQGQTLPASCLVVLSGQHLGTIAKHEAAAIRDGDELVLIAPVAGG